jgi:hypothetical protein
MKNLKMLVTTLALTLVISASAFACEPGQTHTPPCVGTNQAAVAEDTALTQTLTSDESRDGTESTVAEVAKSLVVSLLLFF